MEIVVGEGGVPLATAAGQTAGNASAAAAKTNLDAIKAAVAPVAAPSIANKTIATTATQLDAAATTRGVVVISLPLSAGSAIRVGTRDGVTTSTGVQVAPGQSKPFLCANANLLWAIVETTAAGSQVAGVEVY